MHATLQIAATLFDSISSITRQHFLSIALSFPFLHSLPCPRRSRTRPIHRPSSTLLLATWKRVLTPQSIPPPTIRLMIMLLLPASPISSVIPPSSSSFSILLVSSVPRLLVPPRFVVTRFLHVVERRLTGYRPHTLASHDLALWQPHTELCFLWHSSSMLVSSSSSLCGYLIVLHSELTMRKAWRRRKHTFGMWRLEMPFG